MGQETNAALRRKLRTQRAAYEELLGLAGAIMAALCVRRGDGGTLRLPKQDVHDALTRYEFAAAAEGEDYVLLVPGAQDMMDLEGEKARILEQLAEMAADTTVKPELRLKAAGMVLGQASDKDTGEAEPQVLRFEGALEQWSR